GDLVCEVGCGTARNLARLARRYPEARFFGIDASEEMLRTARANLTRAGLTRTDGAGRVTLAHGLAEDLDPAMFGLDRPFDVLLFSYAFSIFPEWRPAAERALTAVRPGGTVAVVDFGQQDRLPRLFRAGLRRWLSLFGVSPQPALRDHFRHLAECGRGRLDDRDLLRGYAFTLRFTTAP
ncbi:MAG: class I SAM-dependent methyltransferase, partial [Acetobacterales bacterium]